MARPQARSLLKELLEMPTAIISSAIQIHLTALKASRAIISASASPNAKNNFLYHYLFGNILHTVKLILDYLD